MAAVVLTIQNATLAQDELTSQAGHADGVTYDNTYKPMIIIDNTEVANAGTLTIAPTKTNIDGTAFVSQVYTLAAAKSYTFRITSDVYQNASNVVSITLGGAADPTKLLFSAVVAA